MFDSFSGVIAFAFLSTLLLAGTVLRAKVSFLRNSMVPASLIAGVMGFILLSFGLSFGYESSDFIVFTFHFFTLSFMSLCLTKGGEKQSNSIAKGGTWLALLWTMSLALQALIGLAVVLLYNASGEANISEFLGLLVTHGFTQGPGQALAIGSIWQQNFNIENAATIGLIYASFGFIAAFMIGMPIARWMIIKRAGEGSGAAIALSKEMLSGVYDKSSGISAGRQITHSANLDSLAFHISILGLAYLLTHLFLINVQPLMVGTTLFGARVDLFFSHNLFFLWGLIICIILRTLLDAFKLGHFIDDDTQKRITGSSVDFMVVSTIMSIQLSVLSEYFIPLMLVVVSVTLVTALLCFGFAKYLDDYKFERALTSFGCCCGSTGSGLLLLRILDPNFDTPVAKELAFFNVAILVFTFHIALVMSPLLPSFGLSTIVMVYGATVVCALLGLFALKKLSKN